MHSQTVFSLVTSSSVRKPEELLGKAFHFSSYSFLLRGLTLSGAYNPERERRSSHFVFNIICFFVVVVFTARSGHLIGKHLNSDRSWLAFFEFLLSINAFFAVLNFLKNQSLLHRCLHQSISLTAKLKNRSDKIARRLAFVSVSYVCLEVLLEISSLFYDSGRQEFFGLHFPKVSDERKNSMIMVFVAAADTVLRKTVILLPLQLSISLFTALTLAMQEEFAAFNQFFDACSAGHQYFSATSLRLLRATRCDLHDALLELDKLFSPLVLSWFSLFVFCVAIGAMQLFVVPDVISYRLLLLSRFVFLLFWFGLFTSSAVSLSDEANEALFCFQRALVTQTNSDPILMAKSLSMLKQLARPELWLTGWRYFNVDKSAILSAVSAIFTYFVLILEFNPRVKEAIQLFAKK